MITFDEAAALVQAQYPEFDQWIEYEGAWVFGVSGPASFGGSRSPVAVLKRGGEIIPYPRFVAEYPGQQILDEGELSACSPACGSQHASQAQQEGAHDQP